MERTSWVMVLILVLYNNNQYNPTLHHKQSRPGNTRLPRNRAIASIIIGRETPIFRASTISPGGTPTFRATTLYGCRRASGASRPNSLLRLWETPYATLLVFHALPVSRTLSNPARAGIPLWLGSSNTTSRTLITQCVRPAGTDSQLVYYPSHITRTSSGALYQHPLLRNHTIYTIHSVNIIYNSISGQWYGYFKARIHNKFIIHQKHVCSCQEYTSDWARPPRACPISLI